MDFEKLSDRLKGFVQSAQTLAVREGNPQITPEHLLKVLLDDPEGLAAGLIKRAGGNPKQALEKTEAALAKLPKVCGGGRRAAAYGRRARPRARPGRADGEQGRRQLRHGRARAPGALHEQGGGGLAHPHRGRPDPAKSQHRHQRSAQGPHRRLGRRRAVLRCAEALYPRLHRGRRRRQARSGDRPRRGDQAHHPGAVAPHQEQSGADRRAGRRQDGDRRGAGASHRAGRRAGEPEGQEGALPRHGLADRRREISRRVRGAAEIRAERRSRRRRARSFCSSTRCTPWSAPARPTAPWTPPTC